MDSLFADKIRVKMNNNLMERSNENQSRLNPNCSGRYFQHLFHSLALQCSLSKSPLGQTSINPLKKDHLLHLTLIQAICPCNNTLLKEVMPLT